MFQKIVNKLNDLRPKQLLMLAGATAILMFMVIYLGLSLATGSKEIVQLAPEQPPPAETKPVVVAKVNLPPRTRIQESMLQVKEMPVDMVPEGAIESLDDVKDVQIKVSIFAGDILTIQKVFNEKGSEGFVGEIPADCRAVSINVSEVTSVAGFAKPGDKVDLLLVEKSNYSATTNVLLQNVPLLSINQDMLGTNSVDDSGVIQSSAISNPTIATFALPPQDVLKLISASKLGEIYMMLRPSNPRANYVPEMEYTIESVNKPQPKPVEETAPAPVIPSNPTPAMPLPQLPAVQATPKIDIILGDELAQSSEETAQIQTPANPSAGNSALPAIPSGSNQNFTSPPPPNVPLTNSPIVNSFSENLNK